MTETLASMIAAARTETHALAPAEAQEAIEGADIRLVIDVREPQEFGGGRLPGAVNVPRGMLELRADPSSPVADPALTAGQAERILVYCTKDPGARSHLAAQTLQRMGYERVEVLGGGLQAWEEAGHAVERDR